MKHVEKITPVAAMLSALATLACCLPVTFAAATAAASVSIIAGQYRWLLLGLSAAFLAIAAWQLARARACGRRSAASVVIFVASVTVVALVALFPQVLAAIVADWVS